MKLDTIILQNLDTLNSSSEFRACLTFSLMNDIKIIRVRLEELDCFTDILKKATTLPVGSVEFLTKSFILAGKQIPTPLSYPGCFFTEIIQQPELMHKRDIDAGQKDIFIKPYATKLFTGFCLNAVNDDNLHDYATFQALHENEPIWVCPILDIDQEWRVYVQDNKILGYARYDDADTEDVCPLKYANELLQKSDLIHPFCMDVGRLVDGRWTLIEVNDAWAIGLYGRAVTPAQYVEFLHKRWITC